ncbi:MAG: hypothetical protein LBR11_00835, partial [Deltaproteobacteria bacterium]|nr:hypothetical protein [Deltaproteobacteria bacterium]
IFPAVFLYRQYIELMLKNIYYSNSDESKDKKVETIKNCSQYLNIKSYIGYWPEVPVLTLGNKNRF